MSNEEAIHIMKVIIYMLEPQYNKEIVEEAVSTAIQALEQERWIPVSERLPKDNQTEYLVTYKAKGREWINIGFCDEGFWYIYSNDSSPTMEVNVTAWMPLPQPYKAESKGAE